MRKHSYGSYMFYYLCTVNISGEKSCLGSRGHKWKYPTHHARTARPMLKHWIVCTAAGLFSSRHVSLYRSLHHVTLILSVFLSFIHISLRSRVLPMICDVPLMSAAKEVSLLSLQTMVAFCVCVRVFVCPCSIWACFCLVSNDMWVAVSGAVLQLFGSALHQPQWSDAALQQFRLMYTHQSHRGKSSQQLWSQPNKSQLKREQTTS